MIVFALVTLTVLLALVPARLSPRSRQPGTVRRRPLPGPDDPALALDLLAAAGEAGLPPASALTETGAAIGGRLGEALAKAGAALLLGADPHQAWADKGDVPGAGVIRDQMLLVQASGAPAVDLLHAAADGVRRRRRRDAEAAAAALSVRLVLPMGLCALPAFLAFAVVPVVLSLLGSVLG